MDGGSLNTSEPLFREYRHKSEYGRLTTPRGKVVVRPTETSPCSDERGFLSPGVENCLEGPVLRGPKLGTRIPKTRTLVGSSKRRLGLGKCKKRRKGSKRNFSKNLELK